MGAPRSPTWGLNLPIVLIIKKVHRLCLSTLAQRGKLGWGQGQWGPPICLMIGGILMSADSHVSMCGIHKFLGIGTQRQCLNVGLSQYEIHV